MQSVSTFKCMKADTGMNASLPVLTYIPMMWPRSKERGYFCQNRD